MPQNMPQKILHIGKYYPPFMGGIENFMQLLLTQQVKQGYQVKAIVHQHLIPSPLYNMQPLSDMEQGVEIIRVPTYGRLVFAPVSPLFGCYLKQIIQSFQPDVLHIHMPNSSAFWLLASSMAKKIPWVIHWHSDVVLSRHNKLLALAYPFYKPFETALLKRAKAIIATSPDYLNSSLALKKWQAKAHIIPLALASPQTDDTEINSDKIHTLWGTNSSKILSIGRLTYYKGHEDLIRAMTKIKEAKLIIVGIGEQQQHLQQLIQQLHLEEQVYLAGKVNTVTLKALLSNCDIFCLSSIERTEAFGLVLLEAMAYAKPIVVTKVAGSGMNWVVENNHSALFAEKQNFYDLAEKINTLIEKPELASNLGKKGYLRLLSDFNIQIIAEQILLIYR